MNDRRKRAQFNPWKLFFCFALSLIFFSGFTFSTLRLFFTGAEKSHHPQLVQTWRPPKFENVISEDSSPVTLSLTIRDTVIFPDQVVLFLKYPPSTPFYTRDEVKCVYISPNSSEIKLRIPPVSVEGEYLGSQIVRCPLRPRGSTVSLAVKSVNELAATTAYRWDVLVYEALIDRDNTTIVFVKGLNLRSGRVENASRYECVFGWDFRRQKFLLSSEVVSVAQEIVRCKTPLSVLKQNVNNNNNSIKVSVRVVGRRGIFRSVARPEWRIRPNPLAHKLHQMCVCTMLRNQARFLKEWVIYNSWVGVQRWFIYDNNSDDDIEKVIELLVKSNHNISRHVWPWIKSQEAGFAHCALRARDSCEWVGFIDVDEFLHFPGDLSLHNVLNNYSGPSEVAELRSSCYSFGPSGLKHMHVKGVMVGYTCRLAVPERHKSIVNDLQFKTPPPSNSRRKRRVQRRSPASISATTVFNLDVDDETPKKGSEKKEKEMEKNPSSCKKKEDLAAIPCMEKLREELSCAICLEICYEPSTTPCGHSFCKKCLRSAADKCGKRCPKCRQLISNGRSCTVNTVLWNTIQLLFPKEVEARKISGSVDTQESKRLGTRKGDRTVHTPSDELETELESSARRRSNHNLRHRAVRPSEILARRVSGDARNRLRRRENLPVQDEDAALALRLQREEFMEAFRPSDEQEAEPQQQQPHTSSSTMLARANLRAIASRAMNIRVRGRQN